MPFQQEKKRRCPLAFEITYFFHSRKEDGGYDTTTKEERSEKVGKAFEDVPLAKAAAKIMSQLARRDIWVVDVKVVELVRKEISFKESKDGTGIVLKNKRFSLAGTSEMTEEEDEAPKAIAVIPQLPPGVHPHELVQKEASLEELYSNPNKSLPVKVTAPQINPNKKPLYYVYFDPELHHIGRAKQMGLKFQKEKKYPVHGVSGSIGNQKLTTIDDTGKAVVVEEIFFQNVGAGLYADAQLGFSKPTGKAGAKLMYEDELVMEMPPQNQRSAQGHYPVDDGSIPDDLMAMPDIRSKR